MALTGVAPRDGVEPTSLALKATWGKPINLDPINDQDGPP